MFITEKMDARAHIHRTIKSSHYIRARAISREHLRRCRQPAAASEHYKTYTHLSYMCHNVLTSDEHRALTAPRTHQFRFPYLNSRAGAPATFALCSCAVFRNYNN